jgi:hypothetical protein
MPRYLSLWKVNTSLVPQDPAARLKMFEAQAEGIDAMLKGRAVKDFGFFDLERGYALIESSTREEAMHIAALFYPYVLNEPHEIVEWEQAKKAISSAYAMQVQQANR